MKAVPVAYNLKPTENIFESPLRWYFAMEYDNLNFEIFTLKPPESPTKAVLLLTESSCLR